jgi:hypothetical protein
MNPDTAYSHLSEKEVEDAINHAKRMNLRGEITTTQERIDIFSEQIERLDEKRLKVQAALNAGGLSSKETEQHKSYISK